MPENEKKQDAIAQSTRVRLARNYADVPFPGRMSPEQEEQIITRTENALQGERHTLRRMRDLSKNARGVLVEQHLISPELAAKDGGAVLLFILLIVLLVKGCTGAVKDAFDPNLGVYNATTAEMYGIEMDVTDVWEGGVSIELKAKDKCVFNIDGDKYNIKWTLDGTDINVKGKGLDCDGTLNQGTLVLEDVLGMGVNLTFQKEGGFSNNMLDGDGMTSSDGEIGEDGYTAAQRKWNGAWYGWWKMTGCSGSYESMEGQWWDVCGEIAIGADYTGTITLWDEDYTKDEAMVSAAVSLSDTGTGEHGTLTSEGGWFTDVALAHADWIVDPGLQELADIICIDGRYENGDDTYRYEIYLRPWGLYWDDVEEENRPYLYADWYLPLIDAGKSMPDSIGADAPAGSGNMGTTTSNPGGETSGGDGIVTEEQVQKGYVWMNEVNKNIFDATYDDIAAYFGVKGRFVKEEYSDHMKANYRYYKWISEDDDSHFIYVNFKENESGVYTVSAYNTSGFSGTEAIEKYLDIVKAEAAEANKAASANAEMKDFSVEIAQFAKDDVKVKIMTKIPVSGWSFDDSGRCLVENDDPTAFGAGAIRFEVRTNVEDFDYYKDDFENYQDIDDRVIGGITFKGRTYKRIGYDWIQYIAQLDDNRALSIGLRNMDCVPGTMPDIILNNMTFQ